MHSDLTLEVIYKLLLASAVGGAIGLEREFRRKPAGLRTILFICVGSTIFTIVSIDMAQRFGGDETRIAAQIVTGIGFLGAGAILRDRGAIIGLTTAATIWVVAGLGMAIAAGLYYTSLAGAALVLVAQVVLGWWENARLKSRPLIFRITTSKLEEVMAAANRTLSGLKVPMGHFQVYRVGPEFLVEFDAEVTESQQQKIFDALAAIEPRVESLPHEPRPD